jgi:hypothetical protein
VLKTAVLSRVRVGGRCTSDRTDVFSTRTKNKVEKRIVFLFFVIEHKVFFWKRLASALEEVELVDDLILSPNSAKNNEKKEEKKPVKKSTFFFKTFFKFSLLYFYFFTLFFTVI